MMPIGLILRVSSNVILIEIDLPRLEEFTTGTKSFHETRCISLIGIVLSSQFS